MSDYLSEYDSAYLGKRATREAYEKELKKLKADLEQANEENKALVDTLIKREAMLDDYAELEHKLNNELSQANKDKQKLAAIVNEVGHYFKQHNNEHYDGNKLIALAEKHLK